MNGRIKNNQNFAQSRLLVIKIQEIDISLINKMSIFSVAHRELEHWQGARENGMLLQTRSSLAFQIFHLIFSVAKLCVVADFLQWCEDTQQFLHRLEAWKGPMTRKLEAELRQSERAECQTIEDWSAWSLPSAVVAR